MRRPLLVIFSVLLLMTYIYTNTRAYNGYDNDKEVIIKGTVNDKIEKDKYNEYIVGKFLIKDYTKRKNLKMGNNVSIKGTYKNLDDMKFENYDYGLYVKSIGYKGIIYIKSYDIIDNNIIYLYIGNLKSYIKDVFRYLYKEKSDFLNSIVIGKKDYLSNDEKDLFSRTGTSHLIAISGLHTGILCSIIAFIINGINRPYKLIILSIFMFFYFIMVGSSPSIIRSVLSMIILYLSVFLNKKRDGISTLSLIGVFLIVNNPFIIYNISFQLSFLATLSIIYFYGYIKDIFNSSILSITISANILTLPIIYYNFRGIPVFSLVSNIIIMPFIGVIMYLSIISIIIFKINLWASKFVAYFNRIIIECIYYLLYKISNVNFAYIEINNPKIQYVIIYYIMITLYMTYKELKIMKEQENELQGYYKKC
ncbi:ComEC/Rec2 family competence protein [Romboutsia sp. Marseille-P6047]|uniref:ComEC/Rec2 family competence protein n=1 Tax=Romboutsia sp. Marseille-P6047 TaxID=2161817 RepID=UPI000F069199|nr:ComEC/Rec2 family competence protein [Romboutsia sp. Marseille-P6047]